MLQQIRLWLRTGVPREPLPSPAPAAPAASAAAAGDADHDHVQRELQSRILRIVGRALAIRAVDAGSCNACELELQALMNPYYNIEGVGIRFVASPRHADLLLVTGPVSRNMAVALRRTYDAMPAPKRVVAAGGCACTGGIFGESYASAGRVANVIPVDVEIPGCPPTPVALMQGILAAVTPGAASRPR
jgi:Ni,Fe-hydrogenase III small subunit